mmetsp:Transcript_13875/g.31825  ORF Transcript_13875/g.31825 Transcript_13875/m.31825 type:complete len:121 (-) Transcript_13875:477-839(-)
MKVRISLTRMCAECRFVRRRGRLYVTCRKNPRHKQKQMARPRGRLFSTSAGPEHAFSGASCGCGSAVWVDSLVSSTSTLPVPFSIAPATSHLPPRTLFGARWPAIGGHSVAGRAWNASFF